MFLTKEQEQELVISIKERCEIPMKFAYMNEGAKNWEKISQQRSVKGIGSSEFNLLKKRSRSFIESFENRVRLNVIDLGCGDGTQILPLLDVLKNQKIIFQYIPVDISQNLLDVAEKTIKSKYSCEIKKTLFDFELGSFSDITKLNKYSNLICLLGNTIGNFKNINQILKKLKDSMGQDDFLIAGIEVADLSNIDEMLSHYQGKIMENALSYIPLKLGINKKEISHKTSWNKKENLVEVWMTLKSDQKIKIGEKCLKLKANRKILVCRSAKHNEWTFTKLLSDIGFRTELLTTTPDRGYILSMVQSTRYST
ncbi:MAG: L-histidine N(alpha)-methyltransferase [Candidatus Buchananbacteria bacterium]